MKIYTVILLSMIIILSGCSNISNKKIENSKKNIQWIEMKGGETYLFTIWRHYYKGKTK